MCFFKNYAWGTGKFVGRSTWMVEGACKVYKEAVGSHLYSFNNNREPIPVSLHKRYGN